MRTTIIVLGLPLLAAGALHAHKHAHRHVALAGRAMSTEVVTVTEIVTITVDASNSTASVVTGISFTNLCVVQPNCRLTNPCIITNSD